MTPTRNWLPALLSWVVAGALGCAEGTPAKPDLTPVPAFCGNRTLDAEEPCECPENASNCGGSGSSAGTSGVHAGAGGVG